jgi:hypothetical protein
MKDKVYTSILGAAVIRVKNFNFSVLSRLALGSAQPLIQKELRFLSLVIKQ